MGGHSRHGKAVHVDPIKPRLKPPGAKGLKLKCELQLSAVSFKFNLCRYTTVAAAAAAAAALKVAEEEEAAAGNLNGKEKDPLPQSSGADGLYFIPQRPYLVLGRGLHSFPFPPNFSLLCPFPLNLSLLRPPYDPN